MAILDWNKYIRSFSGNTNGPIISLDDNAPNNGDTATPILSYTGWATGSQVQNDSLVNPKPSFGGSTTARKHRFYSLGKSTYASRNFIDNNSSWANTEAKLLLKSPYNTLPANRAVSIRAYLRVDDFLQPTSIPHTRSGGAAGHRVFVSTGIAAQVSNVTKSGWDTGLGVTSSDTWFGVQGYELNLVYKFVSNTEKTLELQFSALNGDRSGTDTTNGGLYPRFICNGSYYANNWYHVRMDIIPTSLTRKKFIFYIEKEEDWNTNTWIKVGEYSIGIDNRFDWVQTNGAIGIAARAGVYAFYIPEVDTTYRLDCTTYFDDFEINYTDLNLNSAP